jgi:outer membrane murein-binding lipoprotein Lpp
MKQRANLEKQVEKKPNYLAFALVFMVLGLMAGYYFGNTNPKENEAEINSLKSQVSELASEVKTLQKKLPVAVEDSYLAARIVGKSANSLELEVIGEKASGQVKTALINEHTRITAFVDRAEEEINALVQEDSSLDKNSPGVRFNEMTLTMNDLSIGDSVTVLSAQNVYEEQEFTATNIVFQSVANAQT